MENVQLLHLNCMNTSYCEITKSEIRYLQRIYLIFLILFSLIGLILNSISAFIFTFSKNSSTKFLRFLRIYSFNSLAISLNDFCFAIYYLCSTHLKYRYNELNRYVNKENIFIYIIYVSVWAFLYTFSGILDMFMIYERLQIYLPSLKFLRNKSAGIISVAVLLYSLIINTPVGIARTINHEILNIESKGPTSVYVYGLREFYYNDIFLLSVFISNFIRDIVSFIIEIILNIVLIVTMTRYYRTRMTINVQNLNTFAFRRTDINNSKIALFLNSVSALFHITTFFLVILLRYISFDIYLFLAQALIFVFSLRHAFNFFLFLKLNKKFRRNFYVLIPKWDMNLKRRRPTETQNNCGNMSMPDGEQINLQTIITRL